jgi:Amt family ammonium transporter
LELALARGELTLEFQPERRIGGDAGRWGGIRAVEALVRWRHPLRGLVPAAAFVPAAEAHGLMVGIGSWVLREAVTQVRRWQESDPAACSLGVAVNMSLGELRREGLSEEVQDLLADVGIAPDTIFIEVRERDLAEPEPGVVAVLAGLRALGVRVRLDDASASDAALARLARLPLDGVKVDPGLVAGLPAPEAVAAVRSLLAAARSAGLDAVAEGVERREQLTSLRDLGCTGAQGHLFGKPLGAAGITAVLREERRQRGGRRAVIRR